MVERLIGTNCMTCSTRILDHFFDFVFAPGSNPARKLYGFGITPTGDARIPSAFADGDYGQDLRQPQESRQYGRVMWPHRTMLPLCHPTGVYSVGVCLTAYCLAEVCRTTERSWCLPKGLFGKLGPSSRRSSCAAYDEDKHLIDSRLEPDDLNTYSTVPVINRVLAQSTHSTSCGQRLKISRANPAKLLKVIRLLRSFILSARPTSAGQVKWPP